MQHVKIKVYVSPNCPYCRAAKEYFRKIGLRFKEVDITRNAKEVEKIFRKTKTMAMPIIEIGNKTVVGFDRRKIEKLLGL